MQKVDTLTICTAILACLRVVNAEVEWSPTNYPLLGSPECNVDDVPVTLLCDPDAILQRANLCALLFLYRKETLAMHETTLSAVFERALLSLCEGRRFFRHGFLLAARTQVNTLLVEISQRTTCACPSQYACEHRRNNDTFGYTVALALADNIDMSELGVVCELNVWLDCFVIPSA